MPDETEDTEIGAIIDREYANFERMCPDDQNPVLSVLRGHLLTEYYIERILHLSLPRGDIVADAGFSYAQKVTLLESLDCVEQRTIQCLKNLNRVRNRCAHEYDKTITAADVELLARPLGREHTEIRRKHEDDVRAYLWEILNCICRNMVSEIYALEQDVLSESEDTDEESPEKK